MRVGLWIITKWELKMKVFENHFDGNPTILIDDRIINSCQNFTIEEAPKVFEKYNVPEKYRKDVLDNYTGKSTEEEILKFIDHPHWLVREAIANQGYELDTLVNDPNWFVREAVAKQGYGLEILVYDPDWFVRLSVALNKKKEMDK